MYTLSRYLCPRSRHLIDDPRTSSLPNALFVCALQRTYFCGHSGRTGKMLQGGPISRTQNTCSTRASLRRGSTGLFPNSEFILREGSLLRHERGSLSAIADHTEETKTFSGTTFSKTQKTSQSNSTLNPGKHDLLPSQSEEPTPRRTSSPFV